MHIAGSSDIYLYVCVSLLVFVYPISLSVCVCVCMCVCVCVSNQKKSCHPCQIFSKFDALLHKLTAKCCLYYGTRLHKFRSIISLSKIKCDHIFRLSNKATKSAWHEGGMGGYQNLKKGG